MEFNEAIDFINSSQTIAILPHVSADGDSLGSAFALKLAFEQRGKTTEVYLEEEIQSRYLFALKNIRYKIISSKEQTDLLKYDLVIVVDSADIKRLGERVGILNNASRSILIDHHMFNDGFTDLNYIDVNWSAAVVGVYKLIEEMNIPINEEIGCLLYVGLVTDTGGFRYSNTNSEAHIIAADLLEYDVDPSMVSQNVFDNMSWGRYLLNNEILKRTEFFFDGKVSMCYLSEDCFDIAGAIEEDGEGIADFLRNIEGVEVGIYIRDKSDYIKISMRARNYVNVASIAAEFNGGGHERASGASWNGDYNSFKERLLPLLEKVI